MSYFHKLAKLGFMVVCRSNRLGTTTMFAVRDETDYQVCEGELLDLIEVSRTGRAVCVSSLDELLDRLPEWRLVDFVGDDASKGAKMLYEKLTCTGPYADWDERLLKHEEGHAAHGGPVSENMLDLLIGFEHRPESERFQPVD